MANYVVTYDLYNPGQNYEAVEQAIQECGQALKVLRTVWHLSSSMNGEQIRAHVAAAMDPNDRLLVVLAANAWGQNIAGNLWNVLLARWNAKVSA